MRILILGGTVFLGRYLVEAALQSGHEITLFNRGQTNTELFPNINKLQGDRDGDLASLAGHKWDVVIDTSGYVPRIVEQTAQALKHTVEHYIYISSISVYADYQELGISEDYPLGVLADPHVEEINGETYGPLKALCEASLETILPGKVLTIRPGLIVGPHDPTDRFTYWPHRIKRGGEILVPGSKQRKLQFIDVRDLSEWIIRMAELKKTGVYNATGPRDVLTMETFVEACSPNEAYNWLEDEYLLEHKVKVFTELPFWIPAKDEKSAGFMQVNIDKALEAGLSFRPLSETIRDTLAWLEQRSAPFAHGMTSLREQQLISNYSQR
ncbi:NAD-dependent epimerase/dehydratase family protein [Paenibacillus psychroresistens]|uniref:NAD-dependent epimerase/dehydratase family protein n=1 Tax=Paenibacillus psychroresistens TaxID=1778678 RepID=A0A6B8RF86_9BACL|nr:NAD-dependent epimerase/dehydratase family protein [Paenibacillus psychroresistens]QGQ94088.1 NAD-dependent epimerase/dehydratase family protein [Paenibacillus psychroresistens]